MTLELCLDVADGALTRGLRASAYRAGLCYQTRDVQKEVKGDSEGSLSQYVAVSESDVDEKPGSSKSES